MKKGTAESRTLFIRGKRKEPKGCLWNTVTGCAACPFSFIQVLISNHSKQAKLFHALLIRHNHFLNHLGVTLKQGYNGDLTSRQAGSIGGQMVKKMIMSYEQSMK